MADMIVLMMMSSIVWYSHKNERAGYKRPYPRRHRWVVAQGLKRFDHLVVIVARGDDERGIGFLYLECFIIAETKGTVALAGEVAPTPHVCDAHPTFGTIVRNNAQCHAFNFPRQASVLSHCRAPSPVETGWIQSSFRSIISMIKPSIFS